MNKLAKKFSQLLVGKSNKQQRKRGKQPRAGKINRSSVVNIHPQSKTLLITTDPYITVSDESQQNFSIQLQQLLDNNPLHMKMLEMFEEWKVARVIVNIAPRKLNGTDPPSTAFYMDAETQSTPNYYELFSYPNSLILTNSRPAKMIFSRVGRQPDFNLWFNRNSTDFRLRFFVRTAKPIAVSGDSYWSIVFQIKVKYRHIEWTSSSKTTYEEKSCDLKSENSSINIKNSQVLKVNELKTIIVEGAGEQ